MFRLTPHDQLHLRNHTDCKFCFPFNPLKKLNRFLYLTTCVYQYICVKERQAIHASLFPLCCSNLPNPGATISHIFPVSPDTNK